MPRQLSLPTGCIIHQMVVFVGLVCSMATVAYSQNYAQRLPTNVHPLLQDTMPPGEIGRIQMARKPQLRGVWQAIEIKGPKGIRVSMADGGQFSEPLTEARVAVMIGHVYRLQITGIPGNEDVAIYPTVEIIDRTHPPPEREHRFPIPIELDEEDLSDAADGHMVMRIVYLEDNEIAEPVNTAGRPQRVIDVRSDEDALQTADRLGRPVAILRIGSRIPSVSEGPEWDNFLFGCPAWTTLKPIATKKLLMEQGGLPHEARHGSLSDRR